MTTNRSFTIVLINTTGIIFKFLSDRNNTTNWTSHIDFSLHSCNTSNISIVMNFPISELCDSPTCCFIIWWPTTFFTDLNITTFCRFWISSKIILTRIFRNTMMMSEFINFHWPTAMTRSTRTTIENNLWRNSNSWESILVHDIDSISYRGCWSMSPTRSTVLRNMLISGP